LIPRSPTPDEQTEELLRRFQQNRARRKRLRLLGGSVAALVVLALVVVGVWALASFGVPSTPADNTDTSISRSPGSTTTELPPSSTPPANSGGPPTSGEPSTGAEPPTSAAPSTTVRPSSTAAPSSTSVSSTSASTTGTLSTSVSRTTTSGASASAGKTAPVVVIDPGHQATPNYEEEPVGPGSNTMKAKVSSGTAGVVTGTPESELVLAVALKLRDSLVKHGVKVVMTRTTQDVNISNRERAQIANKAQADLFVRIHADGSDDHSVRGIHVLYPASIKGWTDDIAKPSKQAAGLMQRELIAATGAVDLGTQARSDLTGFNWSDVPVILAEIGFMTNPEEDRLLASSSYQDKIVQGLTRAILAFLGVS